MKLFLNAIGSEVTKKAYKYQLDRFLKWNKIRAGNYDNLLKADEKVIQRNLEDYLIHLKNKHIISLIIKGTGIVSLNTIQFWQESFDVQGDNDFRTVKGLIIRPSDIFFDQFV